MKHSKVHGAYCLGIFQNGKDPTTLLGGRCFANLPQFSTCYISTVFPSAFKELVDNLVVLSIMFMVGILVRNTLVTYDREHSKIGFWKTNCSELWERLHVSASPPPMPPASEEKNSTAKTQPTAAPTGSPYVLSGSVGCSTLSNFQASLVPRQCFQNQVLSLV